MSIPLSGYWKLLSKYLKPQIPRVILLTILILTNIGLQLFNPQVLRGFIDAAAEGGNLETLLLGALLFLGIAFLSQGLSVAATYVSEWLGWSATNSLRADLALHCLKLDMSFHKERTPGEMIERIDGDVTALSNFFSQFVVQLASNGLLMLGVLILLFREDWRVGLALAVFTAASIFVLGKLRNVAVPHMTAERQASAELYGFLEERLGGLNDIRSNGGNAYTMRRFHGEMNNLFLHARRAWMAGSLMWLATIGLFTVGYIIAFTLGASLYLAGALSLGTVYLFVHYTEMLRRPIEALTRQFEDLQKASAGISRVEELYATTSQIRDGPGTPVPSGAVAVEFNNVSFGYDGDGPVLDDFTFRLMPGRVLGLLGRTGSGKTTLTRLILRLYDPGGGAVHLGGIDLRRMTLADLRRRVGIVTQDVQLFNATLRDNLTIFDNSMPDTRILQVMDELGLADWYGKLPLGLDTVLGSEGAGLSAGESQLLAFARIFLRDPGLVILDEASSRLDPATEALIEHAVNRLLRGRTGIIIAHRLATVQTVDEIMILEGGRIIEHDARRKLAGDPGSRFASLLRTGMEEALA